MIFELVKHATNATAERHGTDAPLHPVRITVVHGPKDLAVRITDEGTVPSVYCFLATADTSSKEAALLLGAEWSLMMSRHLSSRPVLVFSLLGDLTFSLSPP